MNALIFNNLGNTGDERKRAAANSTFIIGGVSCSADSLWLKEVQHSK
jgi:hypothetical protein